MQRFKYRVIAGLMVAMVQPAFADDGLSQIFSTCMDQAGGNTASMVDCIGAET